MNFRQGDLTGFDPRVDLEPLLDAVRGLVADPEGGPGLAALLAALAEKHPMALAEVAAGGRAPGGEVLTRAILPHIAAVEKVLSPRGAYPRLAELGGEAASTVLVTAATRHPAASWLIPLSRRVEGDHAGATHLFAAQGHPGFAAACRAHAEAGHIEGLVLAAGATGRPEPAAALLHVAPDDALRAASRALDANPDCAILAWFAAVYGPEPDALFRRIVPHLRSRAAAVALRQRCAHFPGTYALLEIVIRGMRDG